jgi:putative membrane protein
LWFNQSRKKYAWRNAARHIYCSSKGPKRESFVNYRKSILLAAISTIAALSGMAASGQNAAAPQLSAADFVSQATVAGKTEVAAARVALKNSQSPDVRTFAKRMIKDHTKANVNLAAIATSKQLAVPAHMDAKHRAVVDSLRSQTGAAFDAAYATQMVSDHQEAVALFTSEAAATTDPDLSAFAQKTLPTLKHHQKMADALSAQHPAAAQ